jgi:hypothetical protein
LASLLFWWKRVKSTASYAHFFCLELYESGLKEKMIGFVDTEYATFDKDSFIVLVALRASRRTEFILQAFFQAIAQVGSTSLTS